MTLSACRGTFFLVLSMTTIFLKSLFKYFRSLIRPSFVQTIDSCPKASWMNCLRGSKFGTRESNIIESSSENTMISYKGAILFRNCCSPGRFLTMSPLPKTYSICSRVPETFSTRVLGWMRGCSTSGSSLSEGGLDRYYDIWSSYLQHFAERIVHILGALDEVGDGVGLIFNRRGFVMVDHHVGAVGEEGKRTPDHHPLELPPGGTPVLFYMGHSIRWNLGYY